MLLLEVPKVKVLLSEVSQVNELITVGLGVKGVVNEGPYVKVLIVIVAVVPVTDLFVSLPGGS